MPATVRMRATLSRRWVLWYRECVTEWHRRTDNTVKDINRCIHVRRKGCLVMQNMIIDVSVSVQAYIKL